MEINYNKRIFFKVEWLMVDGSTCALRKLPFCLVLFILLFCSNVYADSNSFTISPGIRFFDYAEYDDDGSFLDGEKDPVLGIGGNFEHRTPNEVVIAVFGEIFAGTVDYDGQLQTGFPLTTNTDEVFLSLGIGIETPFFLLNNRTVFFTNVIYQLWERDILPTLISARLYEVYQWWEISAGIEYFFLRESARTLAIFGRVFYISNPTMQVDLTSDGYGKPILDLGEKTGGELGFEWLTSYTQNHWIGLLGAYKFWSFGRSNDMTVVSDDNLTVISIHEPRSETNNFTLQVVFKMNL